MANGLLAFAAGMGTGYMGAKQRERDQQRQDKQDAWQTEQQDWQREEKQQQMSLQRGLKDATRSASVNENGATLSMADGTTTAYDDGDVAGSDFRQLRRADEATGRQTLSSAPYKGLTPTTSPSADTSQAPADTQPAMGLADLRMPMAPQRTATMNGKAFGSLAEAKAAGVAYDAPEAVSARQAAAYEAAGQPEKAMQIRSGAKQGKLADFQLDKATAEHMNDLANQKIYGKISANGGDAISTAAQLLTETNINGLEGSKAEVKISADGKYKQVVVTAPDGTQRVARQYENNDIGQMRAHQDLMAGDMTTKIKWLHDAQELQIKGNDSAAKLQKIFGDITNATEKNRLTGEVNVAKAEAAEAKAASVRAGKPLAGAVLKQLTEVRDTANTIANLSTTFKDKFAGKGVLGIGADMQLGASSIAGVDTDAVAWWKDYRKQAELVERHALFGAALTPTEQASWRSADIGPNMNKDVIKTNLATRAALTKRIFENTRQDFIDAGHSEERVNAIAGRSSQHDPQTGGATGTWGPENTAKAKSVSVGGVATEARQAPDGKYYVKTANGGYAEVRN